jgi:hypothetical protein
VVKQGGPTIGQYYIDIEEKKKRREEEKRRREDKLYKRLPRACS